jgi:hypothetical protein
MGEHSEQLIMDRSRSSRKQSRKQPAGVLARRLLEVIVYRQNCRVDGKLTLDELEATEIGDWSMPDFRSACGYAASQGWLIVRSNALTLTTAGLAAA